MSAAHPPDDATVSPSQAAPVAGRGPTSGAAQKVRCPHCRNPIQLADDRSDEVLCPACGSTFRLAETHHTDTAGLMRRLGKFQLLERVGLGAFGAVWKARDTELDRVVALKIPHASLLSSAEGTERFYREARAAAQLRHPGIVTVHEVTTLEGLPAIVSDFIAGVTLRDLVQLRPLTFREAAWLVAQLADALDYAHEMGLVHRDLKPSNVMMEHRPPGPDADFGDGAGLGKPLVLDFGLALRDEVEVTMTLDGQVVGTPAYMSPEQAAGKGHHADRRSDVYSLGVVLYELLCGELPFRGTKQLILHQVLHEEPRPPRRLNEKIPRDLEVICLRALAKSPGRRYPTARDLAKDLRRFLSGWLIRARAVRAWERLLLWVRRQPAWAALLAAGAIAALALAALGASLWDNARLRQALTDATRGRADAEQAQAGANASLYLARIALADNAWREHRTAEAETLLDACPVDLRQWEWRYLKRRCRTGQEASLLKGAAGSLVAFSPDGQRLLSGPDVKAWDFQTGRWDNVLLKGGHTIEGTGPAALSLDGQRLASTAWGFEGGELKVWDTATGRDVLTRKGRSAAIWQLALSPDGRRVALAFQDHTITVWDTATGEKVLALPARPLSVTGLALSPDGQRLAAAHGAVKVYDLRSGREVLTLQGEAAEARRLTFSRNGQLLAAAVKDGVVKVWDATTGAGIHSLRGPGKSANSLAFSPDGKRLASASGVWDAQKGQWGSGELKVWDVQTGQEVLTLPGLSQGVEDLAFAPDGARLAAGGTGGVTVWDARPLE